MGCDVPLSHVFYGGMLFVALVKMLVYIYEGKGRNKTDYKTQTV